jgi:hypothetical protein
MGCDGQLKKVGYARKGWQSTDPTASHYKRGRELKRKRAERGRKDADRLLSRKRVGRAGGVSAKRAMQPKRHKTVASRHDTGKAE